MPVSESAQAGAYVLHPPLAAARYPLPQLPADPAASPAQPGPDTPPDSQQLRSYTQQGFGPRKIARLTGCSERQVSKLLIDAGLRKPATTPGRNVDTQWLRGHDQARQRSLKDIAAETGIPVETLAATARNAGIPVRHGSTGHSHPLASIGGPQAFPPAIWNTFSHPAAELRVQRLLQTPGHLSIRDAARQLGIKHAALASQIHQVETAAGTALLHHTPGGANRGSS